MMPDLIGGGYTPPGGRTRQTDTGGGYYSPPKNNYVQQQMAAQEQARKRAQQEAARRAELDRLARQNAQQIAEARRRDYLAQVQAAQDQAAQRARQEAQQREAEARARREAQDAKAYNKFYKPEGEQGPDAEGFSMWDVYAQGYDNTRNRGFGIGMDNYGLPTVNREPGAERDPNTQWGVYDPYGLYGPRYGGEFKPYGQDWYKPDLNMFNWNDGRKDEYMEEIWPTPNYTLPEAPQSAYPTYDYGDYGGGYDYPSYDYPSYDYPEPAKSWYNNMLQWNIK